MWKEIFFATGSYRMLGIFDTS